MLFNSYLFIFIFLPIVLIGWFSLNKLKQYKLAEVFLIGMSLWFYAYFNFSYLFIIVGSCLFNFLISYLINRIEKKNSLDIDNIVSDFEKDNFRKSQIKILGIVGIVTNLGILFYYKYFDFIIENVNSIFQKDYNLKHILLPLGISFFTFQQLSYVVDRMKGTAPHYGIIDYMSFVTFFPQLIAGPIVVHEEMIPQFARIGNDRRSREEKAEIFARGIYVFVLGLAKKVLIADTFGRAVDLAYSNVSGLNGIESLLTVVFYSLQLYFDFSGYCDMAKGIAGMFGMKIANNFNSPYKAVNIVDFWKRWHITLSRFFTKNIYIPLGGNRRGEGRMYLNYLLVFFFSGLWHGAGWNFILWGMMHGVLYVVTKWWLKHKRKREVIDNEISDLANQNCYKGDQRIGNLIKTKTGKMAACILTFIYVSIAWVYFRASSVEQANMLLKNIVTKPWTVPGENFADVFNLGEFWYILKILKIAALPYAKYYIMIVFTMVTLVITFVGKNIDTLAGHWKPGIANGLITAVLFVWCVVSLSGVSTFLYFNF